MIFHAKALEMLTIAYKEILGVDTNSDLEVSSMHSGIEICIE